MYQTSILRYLTGINVAKYRCITIMLKNSTDFVSRQQRILSSSTNGKPLNKLFNRFFRLLKLNSSAPKFYAFRQIQNGNENTCKKHRNCWNCGRETSPVVELFFCDCGVVQKPAVELTYFDLIRLKPAFDIDTKHLSDVFKETQKKLHPDMFSTKSEVERKMAEEQSSLLNKAYSVLLKPLSRALYLLELQGLTLDENSNFTDPEFLMTIMQINEQISSIQGPGDLDTIEESISSNINLCVKKISEKFHEKNYAAAKLSTIKLRYYTTLQERINELRRNLMG